MRLMCKCMNLDGRCPNEHYADTLATAPVEDVRVLVQDFEVPDGTLPVRMQVGDAPVTIIGWVAPGTGNVQSLMREVATELDEIEKGRAD